MMNNIPVGWQSLVVVSVVIIDLMLITIFVITVMEHRSTCDEM